MYWTLNVMYTFSRDRMQQAGWFVENSKRGCCSIKSNLMNDTLSNFSQI